MSEADLKEVAGGTATVGELVEESEIDIGLLVHWQQKGPTAEDAPPHAVCVWPVKKSRPGKLILRAAALELLAPVRLNAVDDADDSAVLAFIGVGTGPTFLCNGAAAGSKTAVGLPLVTGRLSVEAIEATGRCAEVPGSTPSKIAASSTMRPMPPPPTASPRRLGRCHPPYPAGRRPATCRV